MNRSPYVNVKPPEGIELSYNLKYNDKYWRHDFIAICDKGAINIHIEEVLDKDRPNTVFMCGGIEKHWNKPPSYMKDVKAHHDKCSYTGKPCWHDGSSLWVAKNIIPYFEGNVTDFVFNKLINVVEVWIEEGE